MSATSLNKPPGALPRHYRIGGYIISNDAATKWGSQLRGVELHPVRNSASIRKAVLQKTYPLGVNFRQVGEVPDVHWMLITQCEKFDGYKDMDPVEIPKFKPGEKDVHAEELIKEAGIKDLFRRQPLPPDHEIAYQRAKSAVAKALDKSTDVVATREVTEIGTDAREFDNVVQTSSLEIVESLREPME
ncbi:hypothetical protein Clacol_004817 [Clathrus columnatus]|uniref:Uncharacterized protein n=1 Tax=Clathrus columnatus TaxID=1419009 RepID=A0AAV5A8H0_9AGAM|nr:hypothetical protein Clacol_004817 [Clathrus columnatus]